MTQKPAFDPQTIAATAAADGAQPPAVYSTDEQIARLVARMRYMMPGASTAPDVVIWRAAQLAALHQLDPFSNDLYLWSPYGETATDPKDWIVHIGIAAWRRKAQTQARYTLDPRPLTPEEVQHHRGDLYDPADRGCEVTLYRLDVARECKELGIPYHPTVARGLWRKNAFYSKKQGKWLPDSLAETETAADKAAKRAEAKCLKIAFSLQLPTDDETIGGEQEWRVVQDLERQTTNEEKHRAPVADLRDRNREDWDIFA
ncbi:MAG: hypothetical protein R3C14_40525 [Caldilineaceae bacterium]